MNNEQGREKKSFSCPLQGLVSVAPYGTNFCRLGTTAAKSFGAYLRFLEKMSFPPQWTKRRKLLRIIDQQSLV